MSTPHGPSPLPSRPLRRLIVVQLVPEMQAGGVERGTVETAAGLVAQGHRSIVISAGGGLVRELIDHGTEHYDWPIGRKSLATLRLVRRLAKFARLNRVDVLHARSRVPAWVALLAQRSVPRAIRPKLVTTVHGLYSVNRYSSVMARGDAVAVISETAERYVRKHYGKWHPAALPRVYRGVDPAVFHPAATPSPEWTAQFEAEHPQLANKRLVAIVGRLTRCKGHRDFLSVIERLRQTRPDVAGLVIGGEHPRKARYAAELRDAVASRGLSEHVHFLGHRSDVRELMLRSDAVVSCTADPPEAFGRTVLEALSLGTPVVGYDGSGPGEILAHLCPEGRVPAGDIEAMATRLDAFLAQPPAIAANTPFTLDEMVRREIAIYEQVVQTATLHCPRRVHASEPVRRAA